MSKSARRILPAVLAAAILTAVPSTMLGFYRLSGGSMQPTLLLQDVVAVNQAAYGLKVPFTTREIVSWADPQTGDVVLLRHADRAIFKRIAGVPGATVSMRENHLQIDGAEVRYESIDPTAYAEISAGASIASKFEREILGGKPHVIAFTPGRSEFATCGPLTVPAGEYFVLGENRDDSLDSRYAGFGFVPRSAIVGKLIGIVRSPSRAR